VRASHNLRVMASRVKAQKLKEVYRSKPTFPSAKYRRLYLDDSRFIQLTKTSSMQGGASK